MREKLEKLLLSDLDRYTCDELAEIVPRRFILLAVLEIICNDKKLCSDVLDAFESAYNDFREKLKNADPETIRREVKEAIRILIDRLV